MANYFDHLLSLDTPTYTVAQTAKHFEPSTVMWAFHTIQPSSFQPGAGMNQTFEYTVVKKSSV